MEECIEELQGQQNKAMSRYENGSKKMNVNGSIKELSSSSPSKNSKCIVDDLQIISDLDIQDDQLRNSNNVSRNEDQFVVIGQSNDDVRKSVMTNCFFKLREMMIDGPQIKKLIESTQEFNLQRQFFLSSKKLSHVINDIYSLRKQKGDGEWLKRFMEEAFALLRNNKFKQKVQSEDMSTQARQKRQEIMKKHQEQRGQQSDKKSKSSESKIN